MITDMSSLLQEDTAHVAVVFLGENGKKTKYVDLVPRSWLTTSNRKIKCYYSNESEYPFLDEWVSKSKESDRNNWQQFEVNIVKEARKYISKYISNLKFFCSRQP